jgi:hypothetical protein
VIKGALFLGRFSKLEAPFFLFFNEYFLLMQSLCSSLGFFFFPNQNQNSPEEKNRKEKNRKKSGRKKNERKKVKENSPKKRKKRNE